MKTSDPLVRTALLALALAMGSSAAFAQGIWKWRDKDGRVQISDRPPPNEVPDKDILQRPNSARMPVAAPAASDAASDAPATRVDTAKRNQTKAENCQRARNHMQGLESGLRLSRTNEQGQREFLDDNARAAEMARTRETIAINCN
jgi:hypothetical protein